MSTNCWQKNCSRYFKLFASASFCSELYSIIIAVVYDTFRRQLRLHVASVWTWFIGHCHALMFWGDYPLLYLYTLWTHKRERVESACVRFCAYTRCCCAYVYVSGSPLQHNACSQFNIRDKQIHARELTARKCVGMCGWMRLQVCSMELNVLWQEHRLHFR